MQINPNTVKRLRSERGWLQADLARAAGLSQPFVSQVESGMREPSPLVAKALADALGVEVNDLAGRSVTCPNCGHHFAAS